MVCHSREDMAAEFETVGRIASTVRMQREGNVGGPRVSSYFCFYLDFTLAHVMVPLTFKVDLPSLAKPIGNIFINIVRMVLPV